MKPKRPNAVNKPTYKELMDKWSSGKDMTRSELTNLAFFIAKELTDKWINDPIVVCLLFW